MLSQHEPNNIDANEISGLQQLAKKYWAAYTDAYADSLKNFKKDKKLLSLYVYTTYSVYSMNLITESNEFNQKLYRLFNISEERDEGKLFAPNLKYLADELSNKILEKNNLTFTELFHPYKCPNPEEFVKANFSQHEEKFIEQVNKRLINSSREKHDANLQILAALNKYISRIKGYKNSPDGYQSGFNFFKESQALNREANYRLAKYLRDRINDRQDITSILYNLNKTRKQLMMDEHGKEMDLRGINSNELNEAIDLAIKLTR